MAPVVLITGATGFLGSHILAQALEAGFTVKITARPPKVEDLRARYKDAIEVFPVADVVDGDYTDALKGVDAVIHSAASLALRNMSPQAVAESVLLGYSNLLQQAESAGIKKLIVTGTVVSVLSLGDHAKLYSNHVYSEKEWNDNLKNAEGPHVDNIDAYIAAKTLAERQLWDFADNHPDIDITTILPTWIYGPFVPGFPIRRGEVADMSTNGYIWDYVLFPGPKNHKMAPRMTIPLPLCVDVRDCARAHILALQKTVKFDGQQRILVSGPGFTYKEAVEYLEASRPSLSHQLPDTSEAVDGPYAKVDTERSQECLGMQYRDWRTTVDDTVDSLLALHENWGL